MLDTPDDPLRAQPATMLAVDLPKSADGASFAAFRENAQALVDMQLPSGETATDFWFTATLFQSPLALVSRTSGSAQAMARDADRIARGHTDLSLLLFKRGSSVTTSAARRVEAGTGDLLVLDYTQPFAAVSTEYEALHLSVARERLPPQFDGLDCHCAVVSAAEPAALVLAATLEGLLAAAPTLPLPQFDATVEALCVMLAGALSSRRVPTRDDAPRKRVIELIDRRLADSGLGPRDIEQAAGLSRSSLYRLFQPVGGVRSFILRRRLDRIVQALLANARRLDATRLAIDHGFSSADHLSRAFRGRFGLTPAAFHRLVQATGPADLIAQAEQAGFVVLADWLRTTNTRAPRL